MIPLSCNLDGTIRKNCVVSRDHSVWFTQEWKGTSLGNNDRLSIPNSRERPHAVSPSQALLHV